MSCNFADGWYLFGDSKGELYSQLRLERGQVTELIAHGPSNKKLEGVYRMSAQFLISSGMTSLIPGASPYLLIAADPVGAKPAVQRRAAWILDLVVE